MGSNLGLDNLDEMMVQISRDHSRLDAELSNIRDDIKSKEANLQTILKEMEITRKEKDKVLKRIHEEKRIAEELNQREVKLRENMFGTDTEFTSSKLFKVSGLRSDLQQAKMKKDHSHKRIQNIENDIDVYMKKWDAFENESPLIKRLEESKYEVEELQRKLDDIYLKGKVEDIQKKVNELKEAIKFQNIQNDKYQEESVSKKNLKKQLENQKQQLTTEIRCLENRAAAKKKLLSNTIADLTAQLLIQSSSSTEKLI